jgi:GNAT superfamily N-acetyltransferase
MDVQQHEDPRVFQTFATPFYATDTLRHTVALTVMARFLGVDRPQNQPIMATLHGADNELIGVALRTPPWPVIVSGLPTDPDVLETFLTRWLEFDPELPGVTGPLENAHAVADVWTKRSGGTTKVTLSSRLFRLGELTPPDTRGQARAATRDDLDLMVKWREDFEIEALGYSRDPGEGPASISRMFDNSDTIVLWEDGGEPVSWAAASAPIAGMSRVGPVYTPPEHREHGFGSAVTAAASQGARDAGATDVILFTDTTNPTSNSIYQKIGYRPLYDSTELEFVRLPSTV